MISHDTLIFLTGAFGGAWTAIVGTGLWGRLHVHRHGLTQLGATDDDSRSARPGEHEIAAGVDMRREQSPARIGLGAALRELARLVIQHAAHPKHTSDRCQWGQATKAYDSTEAVCNSINATSRGERWRA